MNLIMVVSPYYVETITDTETGAKSVARHRLSEAAMLYDGRYTIMRDWLALPPDEIVPDHGLAVDVLWFDGSAEEQAALAEIRAAYAVLMEAEGVERGSIPSDWPR